ncbi:LacI family DNA-binding transcriptional regulator [Occultella aeris]|nr:LacI family DNA-binding transcriptional regulator [Occultella aeris]
MTTLQDVAAHAGVSPMTVSNVVNGRPGVAESTRLLVDASIRHLGYKPNLSARRLAKGRTGMLTLSIPEVEIPYFAEISSAMLRAALERSMDILINQSDWDRDRELDLIHGSMSLLTDGILLYPSTLTQSDLNGARPGVPLVLFGGSEVFTNVDHVVIDNVAAAQEATEHLVSLGHRRIALIGPHLEPNSRKPNGRLAGYARALEVARIKRSQELLVNVPTYHRVDGYRAMQQLFELPQPPTAVFCLSDLLAVGALHAAYDRGVAVPGELSIMGFDDVEESRYSNPALTTIKPDKLAIARHALDLISGPGEGSEQNGPRTVITNHELVIRASTAAPSRPAAH